MATKTQQGGIMNHKTLIQEIFTYYSKSYSPLILSIWEDYLIKHLTIEEMKQATYAIITEEKFFPTPALIVEKVKGNPKEQGLKTWYDLLTCDGNYKSFSPSVRQILAKVGHIHLMNKTELSQAKRDFLELFALDATDNTRQKKILAENNNFNSKILPENNSPNETPVNPKAIQTISKFKNQFGS